MYDQIYTDKTDIHAILTELAPDQVSKDLFALVDGRGLNCPMPLLKTKIALRNITTGSIHVVATDKNSATDIGAFCQKNSLSLQSWQNEHNGMFVYHFLITKHP